MLKLGLHPAKLDISRINSGHVEFRPEESSLGVKKVCMIMYDFFFNFAFYKFRFQYLHSLMALTSTELDCQKNQKRLDASTMALEALRNVIKNNSGKLLFVSG